MSKGKKNTGAKLWRKKQARRYLLTPQARTRKRDDIARMSEDEVYAEFLAARFASNGGKPTCPKCNGDVIRHYTIQVRSRAKHLKDAEPVFRPKRIMSCKACAHQFTIRSGTKLAYSRREMRDELTTIMSFVNHVGGEAALLISRDHDVDYRTALVFSHKMREAMAGMLTTEPMDGVVQVDGVYLGGRPRKSNNGGMKSKSFTREEDRQGIFVVKSSEHTRVFEHRREANAKPDVLASTKKQATIWSDSDGGLGDLRMNRRHETVSHNREFSRNGVHVNDAEAYNARLRLAHIGVFHGCAGPELIHYAEEMAWRDENRRVDNGTQCTMLLEGLLTQPMSTRWRGYWQFMRGKVPAWFRAEADQ